MVLVLLANQLPAVEVVEQEGLGLETPAPEVPVVPALPSAEVEVEVEVEQLVVMVAQLKMLQA